MARYGPTPARTSATMAVSHSSARRLLALPRGAPLSTSGNAAARCLVLRRSRRGDRLPWERFVFGTGDLDVEVRQRQLERRGQQRGRQDEQRIPAHHVSFLSITHRLSVETPRRTPTVHAGLVAARKRRKRTTATTASGRGSSSRDR